MRADVLVACSFCGLCLMLEAPKECLGDVRFEVHARILCNHPRPEIFGKRLIADTEHIQTYSVVQELHLQRLVGCDTGCCVESNCVPGRLDPRGSRRPGTQLLSTQHPVSQPTSRWRWSSCTTE